METTFDTAVKPALSLSVRLLISPLRAIVLFFAPWQQAVANHPPAASPQMVGNHFTANAANKAHYAKSVRDQMPASHNHQTLRVLRVVDASCSRHSAGRMKISGRFTEVCAELDRLSQQEAA